MTITAYPSFSVVLFAPANALIFNKQSFFRFGRRVKTAGNGISKLVYYFVEDAKKPLPLLALPPGRPSLYYMLLRRQILPNSVVSIMFWVFSMASCKISTMWIWRLGQLTHFHYLEPLHWCFLYSHALSSAGWLIPEAFHYFISAWMLTSAFYERNPNGPTWIQIYIVSALQLLGAPEHVYNSHSFWVNLWCLISKYIYFQSNLHFFFHYG